jgi:hypothetical protein
LRDLVNHKAGEKDQATSAVAEPSANSTPTP